MPVQTLPGFCSMTALQGFLLQTSQDPPYNPTRGPVYKMGEGRRGEWKG